MIRKINDLTPEEVIDFNRELNDDFNYFLQAYPNIELGDTTDGVFMKLRAQPRQLPIGGEDFSIADIFFDLQWKLHIQKNKHENISKMIVSDLHLLPRLANTAFSRGVGLKIKFI